MHTDGMVQEKTGAWADFPFGSGQPVLQPRVPENAG